MQPARSLAGRATAAPPARTRHSSIPGGPAGARRAAAPLPPAAAQNPFAALFQPKKQAAGASPPATAALVDELLALAKSTRAGVKPPAAKADRIAELAAELAAVRGRAPTTRSPFFFGRYAVSYCSNPAAPGGPVLTSGPGRALAVDQKPQQVLEPVSFCGERESRMRFFSFSYLDRDPPRSSPPLLIHPSIPSIPRATTPGPPDQPRRL